MKIKGNGRSALILAAGLWVCFAGPSQAAAATDATAASSTAGTPLRSTNTPGTARTIGDGTRTINPARWR